MSTGDWTPNIIPLSGTAPIVPNYSPNIRWTPPCCHFHSSCAATCRKPHLDKESLRLIIALREKAEQPDPHEARWMVRDLIESGMTLSDIRELVPGLLEA